jgi:hypothetical protein
MWSIGRLAIAFHFARRGTAGIDHFQAKVQFVPTTGSMGTPWRSKFVRTDFQIVDVVVPIHEIKR